MESYVKCLTCDKVALYHTASLSALIVVVRCSSTLLQGVCCPGCVPLHLLFSAAAAAAAAGPAACQNSCSWIVSKGYFSPYNMLRCITIL